eukprot:gene12200-11989_t
MESLRIYLNSLPPDAQDAYAKRCGTSVGYLRKAISTKQQLGAGLCVALDRESGGRVQCDELLRGVDWVYLRAKALQVSATSA